MAVVVGVDGAGRSFRLRRLAAAFGPAVWWVAGDLAAGLARAREDGALVVVDDAHRLAPDALATLAAAARDGVPMVISRRPTIAGLELAALDEAVAAGGVEVADALDHDEVATLVATATGRTVSPETAAAVHDASAGLAAVAAALAAALAAEFGQPGGRPGSVAAGSMVCRVAAGRRWAAGDCRARWGGGRPGGGRAEQSGTGAGGAGAAALRRAGTGDRRGRPGAGVAARPRGRRARGRGRDRRRGARRRRCGPCATRVCSSPAASG